MGSRETGRGIYTIDIPSRLSPVESSSNFSPETSPMTLDPSSYWWPLFPTGPLSGDGLIGLHNSKSSASARPNYSDWIEIHVAQGHHKPLVLIYHQKNQSYCKAV